MSENRDFAQVFRNKNFTVIDLSAFVCRVIEKIAEGKESARPEGFEPESLMRLPVAE